MPHYLVRNNNINKGNFSSETVESRRQWNNMFKALK